MADTKKEFETLTASVRKLRANPVASLKYLLDIDKPKSIGDSVDALMYALEMCERSLSKS